MCDFIEIANHDHSVTKNAYYKFKYLRKILTDETLTWSVIEFKPISRSIYNMNINGLLMEMCRSHFSHNTNHACPRWVIQVNCTLLLSLILLYIKWVIRNVKLPLIHFWLTLYWIQDNILMSRPRPVFQTRPSRIFHNNSLILFSSFWIDLYVVCDVNLYGSRMRQFGN